MRAKKMANKQQYLPQGALMPSPKSPVADWLPRNNEEYKQAYRDIGSANPLDQILGTLSLGTAPLNQMSSYLGDKAFDYTGSPGWSTAAYMVPQLAGFPLGAVKNVAKGVLSPLHNVSKNIPDYIAENAAILQSLRSYNP